MFSRRPASAGNKKLFSPERTRAVNHTHCIKDEDELFHIDRCFFSREAISK
jgi:hypothetical protein